MASREQKKSMLVRQTKVAKLLARRIPKMEIAKMMKVSPATITRDDKAILEEIKKQFALEAGDLKSQYLRDIEELLSQAWEILLKSKEDREVTKTKTGDANYTETQKIGQAGSPQVLLRILDILKERAELTGIREIISIPEALELIIREPTMKEVERDTKSEED